MAELLFFRDRELQMRSPIRADRIVLGRASESDFTLPDRGVSRRQCELVRKGNGYQLIDLSGRGTSVSNRVAADRGTVLRDGDSIHLGAFTVVYSVDGVPKGANEITALRSAERSTASHRVTTQPARPRNAWLKPFSRDTAATPLNAEDGFSLSVGSAPGAHGCTIEDRFVSAEHFRITLRDSRWLLIDRTSTNGTFVDGVQVVECVLPERATIRVGETLISFLQELDPGKLATSESLPGLVTRDPTMQPIVECVQRVAPSIIPVSIHGETGVGKEVIARAIHLLSRRAEGPFVALNCGAIARDTVESELFGHEKGAFTGADKARIGAFEEANGGTLFLDEVGDLQLGLQVKLLRAIEKGEIRRLGASRTQSVDVRIVSATHRDLRAGVEEGTFREDLYYRLCVAPVEVPPLRQRVADVMPLAEHFAAQLNPGDTKLTFVPAARARLESHPWYGNARELRNAIQLALLNRSGSSISADDILFQPIPSRRPGTGQLQLAGRTMEQIERECYRLALERFDGDRKAAMTELGVPRSTFFRKLDEFQLTRQEPALAAGGRSR